MSAKKSHNNQMTVVRGRFGRRVERPLKAFGDGRAKKALLASTMRLMVSTTVTTVLTTVSSTPREEANMTIN